MFITIYDTEYEANITFNLKNLIRIIKPAEPEETIIIQTTSDTYHIKNDDYDKLMTQIESYNKSILKRGRHDDI